MMHCVTIACEVKHKTDQAVLIHDGASDVWVPLSLIENRDDIEVDSHVELEIAGWFAGREGLI